MPSSIDLDIRNLMVPVRRHSLQVRTLSVGGTERRDRPVMVFLHEGLGCIEFWRDFPERMVQRTGLDAVVYDRRGYGKSSPVTAPREKDYLHREANEELPRLLEALSIDRIIPVGHSDGGTIALLYAASFGRRVEAVVTLAAHVFVEPLTLDGIRETVERYQTGDLKERLSRYHGQKTEWVFHSWADTWLSDGFRDWNIESFLPQIGCPVLVIQGEDDEYGGREQVEAITSGIGASALPLLVPGCGHSPHLEAPGAVVDETAHFICRASLCGSAPGSNSQGDR
ncbi:MAG: alpha/beta fold hydrolase [Desulfobacterales bacterium]